MESSFEVSASTDAGVTRVLGQVKFAQKHIHPLAASCPKTAFRCTSGDGCVLLSDFVDAVAQSAEAFPVPFWDWVKFDCSIGIRTKVCGSGTSVLGSSSEDSSPSVAQDFGTFTVAPC